VLGGWRTARRSVVVRRHDQQSRDQGPTWRLYQSTILAGDVALGNRQGSLGRGPYGRVPLADLISVTP
jgi:hypothetical protein